MRSNKKGLKDELELPELRRKLYELGVQDQDHAAWATSSCRVERVS
jgi:hypothetical protein